MKFFAYGMNHTTAPLQTREKYALAPDGVMKVLEELKATAAEAVFLSTCNRVEFYVVTDAEKQSLEKIRAILGRIHRLKPVEVQKYFYFHEGSEAFFHLFRVASSLDSMVVGETQILGQVKDAFEQARQGKMAGSILHGVFNRTFAAAKRVRTQTDIARMPTNVSSVAVDLAGKIFSDLSNHRVLLLGAGEMGELTSKYLTDAGVRSLFIANRTLGKAKGLTAKLGGEALTLEDGLGKLEQMDIIITSVGGGKLRLVREQLERAMKSRYGKPLLIIDIAVPRNVDPGVGEIESVYLYNVDNLAGLADANRSGRLKAVESAENILREEMEKICSWYASLELVPTVVRLREHFEGLQRAEWGEFLKKHPNLPENERKDMERLVHDLTAKLLHAPSANLKKVKTERDRLEYARMLNELFSLVENPENE